MCTFETHFAFIITKTEKYSLICKNNNFIVSNGRIRVGLRSVLLPLNWINKKKKTKNKL